MIKIIVIIILSSIISSLYATDIISSLQEIQGVKVDEIKISRRSNDVNDQLGITILFKYGQDSIIVNIHRYVPTPFSGGKHYLDTIRDRPINKEDENGEICKMIGGKHGEYTYEGIMVCDYKHAEIGKANINAWTNWGNSKYVNVTACGITELRLVQLFIDFCDKSIVDKAINYAIEIE